MIKIPQSVICPAPCAVLTIAQVLSCKYFHQLSLHKMSSFLYVCAHVQCHVNFIHHVELYFRFQHLITFPVQSQLWQNSQGEKSSSFFSGNIEIYILCKGRLPSKVVVRQRSSPVKGCLPSNVVFRHMSSSIKGGLPSNTSGARGTHPPPATPHRL